MFEAADSVIETHRSWVYFVGDRVYKRKKPVRTGFLDFSSPEARRAACEEEVRLGRRVAPDVYLGVEELPGPDWVVVMCRMPAERRLASLVARRRAVDDGVRDVARRVASLHLQVGRSPAADAAASAAVNLAHWEANHAEMAPFAQLLADPALADHVLDLARRYVAGRSELFAERVAAGRAVDGHGDLRADEIFLLPDGPRILDAIEFDPGLRAGDGLADIAFLAMDLERLGDRALGRRFMRWYAEFAADRWPTSLADFYIAYRAQARAKVACLRSAHSGHAAAPEADALLRLADSHLRAGRIGLVLVGGPPSTGKTSIARELGGWRDWVVLHGDEVRSQLAGIPSTTSASAPLMAGVCTAAMTSLTYGALLRRAHELLERGESVILDAPWAEPAWRDEARRVASRTSANLAEVRCAVPVAIAAERAHHRLDATDARPGIAWGPAERFAPWPEAVVIDTRGTPERSTRLALTALEGLGRARTASPHPAALAQDTSTA